MYRRQTAREPARIRFLRKTVYTEDRQVLSEMLQHAENVNAVDTQLTYSSVIYYPVRKVFDLLFAKTWWIGVTKNILFVLKDVQNSLIV